MVLNISRFKLFRRIFFYRAWSEKGKVKKRKHFTAKFCTSPAREIYGSSTGFPFLEALNGPAQRRIRSQGGTSAERNCLRKMFTSIRKRFKNAKRSEKRSGTCPKRFQPLSCRKKNPHQHFSKKFHRPKVSQKKVFCFHCEALACRRPPQFLKKKAPRIHGQMKICHVGSGNRSGSCSENCGFRIAKVMRRHSKNGISHSENYSLNSESCSENTPELSQNSPRMAFSLRERFS